MSLETAVEIYRGPFLSEYYSDWCVAKRDRLAEHFKVALLALAEIHLRRERYERAVDLCERALETDPYHEDALLLLVRVLVAAGDRLSALGRYRRFVEKMKRGIGETPSFRLAQVAKALREGASIAV